MKDPEPKAAITAILADDERLMREQLRARLNEAWPELMFLAEAKNGAEAVAMVEEHDPDFAFLDIRMPGMTGIEAARAILDREGNTTQIVFITAYDQYAVEAFEQGAIDYVLKPADRERIARTVERLKGRVERLEGSSSPAHASLERPDVAALLARLAARLEAPVAPGMPASASATPRLQWIQASVGQSLRLIPVDEVLFFQSDEKYTRVQTAQFEALIKKPIKELIDELDPDRFWQIHRATLVNAQAIATVTRDFRGRQIVTVTGHPQKLEVSRTYTHLFKQM
ncbi:MAG: LytTR family DNA-binding domain-containing protein [Burkholderiaceae bacterium]